MYRIGLDVGSTTLKLVALNEDDQIVYKSYRRHRSMIKETALEAFQSLMDTIGGDAPIHLAVTGSAGIGFAEAAHLPFIQEVVATQLAVEERFHDIDVVIELGGEDAKILFLTEGTEVRMNGTCAGGTGAFIDQMAVLLSTELSEMDEMALTSDHIYPIASRCGVFAKTDVQPLLNQGAAKADVAMSIFHAVVNQTISGLAQGRKIKGRVMFLGGPLTFLKGLQKAFQEVLGGQVDEFIFPEDAQYFVALGTALYSGAEPAKALSERIRQMEEGKAAQVFATDTDPLFEDEAEYDAFVLRHRSAKVDRADLESYEYPVYLGIDAGSTTVKLVVVGQNGELLYEMYQASDGDPVSAIRRTLLDIYAKKPDIRFHGAGVTGYGEELIKSAFRVDFGIVETIAHLTAAQHFDPEVDFIIDIGGQDMKCFKIRNGIIDTIFLNEACSSGCGSFISTFANALGYQVADFARLGLFAEHPVDLGSRCTVFMNSSVKQAQKEGAGVEDISAGLSMSVVKNALYKVIRVNSAAEIGQHIVVQGGTFYNDAILRAFEREIGGQVIRPDIAGLMGAYGCAIYAAEQGESHSNLLSKEELETFEHHTEIKICDLCGNHCQLTVNRFSGGRNLIAGNRCERPIRKEIEKTALPNQYAEKRRRLAKVRNQSKLNDARGTIGLPLGLNMYEMYPFWNAFWRSLRFNVVFSPFSNKRIYLKGQQTIPSDTVCYPAKLMHGHVEYLIDKKVDAIFYPCLTYNFDEEISDNHYNCPVVAYYPQVLEANVADLKQIPYLHPFYGVHNKGHFKKVIAKDLKTWFGIGRREVYKAVDAAYEALDAYYADMTRYGQEAIATARALGKPIIVLAGRPYHIDPEINHGIDQLIESFDAVVVSEDALPFEKEDTQTSVLNQWTYHARLYNAAKLVRDTEDMFLVQLVSFGCGLDAITTDEVWSLVEAHGDIYTQIKIDEINNLGAVRIRLRSLFAAIEQKRRREAQHAKKEVTAHES